jgi:antirestriction protein ArdC
MKKTVHEIITEQFLSKLKEGEVPWQKPWKLLGERPTNLKTKNTYKGVNILLLLMENRSKNFWGSYKQWGSMGANVKAGESGTKVIFWKWLNEDDPLKKKFPMLRYYTVFNIDQVENLDPKYIPAEEELPEFVPIDKASEIFHGMPKRPQISMGGDRAYYRPSTDEVQLPLEKQFHTPEEFYSTAFHELVHSTGHQNRLDRKEVAESDHFGSDPYAKEELVAELGASFLCSECNILERTFDNSAGYLSSWIKQLEKNPKWIISASSKAEKASNFILGKENYEV